MPRCERSLAEAALSGMGRLEPRHASPPGCAEVPLEIAEGSIKQLATRDDDDVDACDGQRVEMPEEFAYQPFGSIAVNRVAELSRGDDPEPACRPGARREDQREIPG